MRLHAATSGKGPPLVLVHGWGLHSGIWAPLLPALERRFRVTAIDLPGHGLSPRDGWAGGLEEMAALVAAAAPPGAAWLGWSLGGQAALAAAAAGHIQGRLALVASTPRFASAPDWPCGMAPDVLAGFAGGLARDPAKALRDFLTLQLRGDRRSAALLAELKGALAARPAPDTGALRAGLEILATADLRPQLDGLRQPVLVIAGERDRLTPAEAGRRLAAAVPAGQYLELPGAAHVPFLSHPEQFVAALAAFLAGEGDET
jgi:pimeloyl-[acyl-carrier protein] methyl ester esterase